MQAKRTPKTPDGRQRVTCTTWTQQEHEWLTEAARLRGVTMAKLLRDSVAKLVSEQGGSVPETLVTQRVGHKSKTPTER